MSSGRDQFLLQDSWSLLGHKVIICSRVIAVFRAKAIADLRRKISVAIELLEMRWLNEGATQPSVITKIVKVTINSMRVKPRWHVRCILQFLFNNLLLCIKDNKRFKIFFCK